MVVRRSTNNLLTPEQNPTERSLPRANFSNPGNSRAEFRVDERTIKAIRRNCERSHPRTFGKEQSFASSGLSNIRRIGIHLSDRARSAAKRDGKMAEVKPHEMLCGAEGVKMIQDDIAAGATHIMIAACSRRAKVEAFNFTDVAMSRANLREGVIWLRPECDENQETTQEMADDYIRMACAEAKYMTKPSPSGEQELNKTLLVVGGGVTGMTSAIEVAKAGYAVHLVAEEDKLGGVWADLYKRVPFRAATRDTSNRLGEKLPQPEDPCIEANDKITVHLSAKITKTSGAPGRFSADISTESGTTTGFRRQYT